MLTFYKMDLLTSEPSLYVKRSGANFLMVCLYVDDLIYAGTNHDMVQSFKEAMMKEYEMTDLGLMKYFLGIQVKQTKARFLSHKKNTFMICLKSSDWRAANQSQPQWP